MEARSDLDAEAWATLRSLLDQAMQIPSSDRDAWLGSLGPARAHFEPRLRSLLAHADRVIAESQFESIPGLAPAGNAEGSASAGGGASHRPGSNIGPYRLVSPLGEGGMGTVWLAERTDILVRRPVALKLPRLGARPGMLAERMAREREILAALDHPNIARLYDAGLAEDGQPYLALEYVHGEPIDVHCRRLGIDLAGRVGLLLQVARAVAHAHSRLVVHRDLKPTNILVNEAGDVRLLDFGIARLLDDEGVGPGELTQQVGRALTPTYAAPEQILGEPISTASDVYSLGVVCYQLLSGCLPYRPQRKSAAMLEEAILRAEPERPSTVAPAQDRRRLRGDLDSIALKALKKAPVERYATAQAVADDLARWLAGRPVLAQPDGLAYRVKRFVLRNKLSVGAAAAVLVAILAGAGTTLWQARAARAEQVRAEQVKELLASVFRDADPYAGKADALTAQDLLVQAVARIDGNEALEAPLRVELMNLIVASLSNLQDYDTAEPLAERNVTDAQRLLPKDDEQTLVARLQRAEILRFRGRQDDLQAELDQLSPALSDAATSPELALQANRVLFHLRVDQGRLPEAVELSRHLLDETRRLMGAEHPLMATSLLEVGLALQFDRQYAAALPSMTAALDLLTGPLARGDLHPQVIDARFVVGMAECKLGRFAEGTAGMQRALGDAITRFGADSTNVGFYHANLAFDQTQFGDLEAALANIDRAIEVLGAQLDKASMSYGATLHNRAVIRLNLLDFAGAAADAKDAHEALSAALGADHDRTRRARIIWLQAAARSGRAAEVVPELEQLSASVATASTGTALPRSLHALGLAYRLSGRPDDALAAQDKALAALSPPDDLFGIEVQYEKGLALLDLGRFVEAVHAFDQGMALHLDRKLLPTPALAQARTGLGRALLEIGEPERACDQYRQAKSYWEGVGARAVATPEAAARLPEQCASAPAASA